MLGGFDATAFKGLPISDFSLLLIVIFTVIIIRFFSWHLPFIVYTPIFNDFKQYRYMI